MSYRWFPPHEPNGPAHVATYDIPALALEVKMSCGHPVAYQHVYGWGCKGCDMDAYAKRHGLTIDTRSTHASTPAREKP